MHVDNVSVNNMFEDESTGATLKSSDNSIANFNSWMLGNFGGYICARRVSHVRPKEDLAVEPSWLR